MGASVLAVINLAKDAKGFSAAGTSGARAPLRPTRSSFWAADQKCRLADYLPARKNHLESRLGAIAIR